MDIMTLKTEPRGAKGSAASRRLRREGNVPCVLYGHNEEVVELSVGSDAVDEMLESGQHVVRLEINGKPERAMIKSVQINTWATKTLHVDFVRVGLHETVNVAVEVTGHGTPKAVLAGGVLEQPLHAVDVECAADAIPDGIRVEIGDLEAGAMIHVGDLPPIDGVTFVTEASAILFIVHERRGTEDTEEASDDVEAKAEPEVIGRAAKDGDDASPKDDA